MDIKSNLVALLDSVLPNNETKKRNIEIVLHLYGFRGSVWPTLDETSRQFDEIDTRERIRQIKQRFLDKVSVQDFPALNKFRDILETRRYWISIDLEEVLENSGFISDNYSIPGLFSLMEDIGVEHEYAIYTPEIKEATRNSYPQYNQHFILLKSNVSEIQQMRQAVQGLPGRYGIINLRYLVDDHSEFRDYESLLKSIILNSKNVWCREESEDFWYILETRGNSIVNLSEKVFSVLQESPVDKLAETLRNALSARKHKYPFPSKELIAEYLRTSSLFDCRNGNIRYRRYTSALTLTEIEHEIIEYYRENGEFTYPKIASFLDNRDYGKPYIDRAIYKSPFIHIDRSRGRGNFVYGLVGELKEVPEARYWEFRNRLEGIENTDADAQIQRRKEQDILREWLFAGKTQEVCALCGELYTVASLITAHKKKRSICTTEERLDPYIVMPVCRFGCDYLYENQYVLIQEGIVTRGASIESADKEHFYIDNLVGREIPNQWRQGPQDYFHSLAE